MRQFVKTYFGLSQALTLKNFDEGDKFDSAIRDEIAIGTCGRIWTTVAFGAVVKIAFFTWNDRK